MANHTKRIERRRADNAERRQSKFDAHHRWARMAASKVKLVADQVRGLPINQALEQLQFSTKRAARMIGKVVRSALANAEYQISERKLDLDVDKLFVSEVRVGVAPSMKRYMTRSRGMAYQILKHSCHIGVTLAPGAEARA